MTASTAPPFKADASQRQLVLASSSPYRRALLARLGRKFCCAVPALDESASAHETPLALVNRLSRAKAVAVAGQFSDALIIGSDQLAVNGTAVLGKPGGRARAIQQLSAASGRTVEFLTGVCLLDTRSGQSACNVVSTQVTFRPLSAAEIAAYVDLEQPYDCAGSFKIEGLGIALFERIVSDDPSALMGLPLITLTSMLEAFGYSVLLT